MKLIVLLRERKRDTTHHVASHWGGGIYLDRGAPTLAGEGKGVPTLARGYRPWPGGTHLGPGGYLPWLEGDTYLGQDRVPPRV